MKVEITITDDKNQTWKGESELSKINTRKKSHSKIEITEKKRRKGASQGINLLIEDGFFNKPKFVSEIQIMLEKKGYYYPQPSTDSRLRKLVDSKKFTRMKKEKKWKYVIRK